MKAKQLLSKLKLEQLKKRQQLKQQFKEVKTRQEILEIEIQIEQADLEAKVYRDCDEDSVSQRDKMNKHLRADTSHVPMNMKLISTKNCKMKDTQRYLIQLYSIRKCKRSVLLVPRIKNHPSSFELAFLNIFFRQNLLRSLSLVLFLLQPYKYSAKKCPKPHSIRLLR